MRQSAQLREGRPALESTRTLKANSRNIHECDVRHIAFPAALGHIAWSLFALQLRYFLPAHFLFIFPALGRPWKKADGLYIPNNTGN